MRFIFKTLLWIVLNRVFWAKCFHSNILHDLGPVIGKTIPKHLSTRFSKHIFLPADTLRDFADAYCLRLWLSNSSTLLRTSSDRYLLMPISNTFRFKAPAWPNFLEGIKLNRYAININEIENKLKILINTESIVNSKQMTVAVLPRCFLYFCPSLYNHLFTILLAYYVRIRLHYKQREQLLQL